MSQIVLFGIHANVASKFWGFLKGGSTIMATFCLLVRSFWRAIFSLTFLQKILNNILVLDTILVAVWLLKFAVLVIHFVGTFVTAHQKSVLCSWITCQERKVTTTKKLRDRIHKNNDVDNAEKYKNINLYSKNYLGKTN